MARIAPPRGQRLFNIAASVMHIGGAECIFKVHFDFIRDENIFRRREFAMINDLR